MRQKKKSGRMRWGEWESLTWTWEKSCKCNSPFAYPSAWISISLTLSLLSYSFTLQSDFICIYEYSFSAPSTNPPTHFVLRSPVTCVPLSLLHSVWAAWIIDKSIKKVWQRLMVGKYFTETSSRRTRHSEARCILSTMFACHLQATTYCFSFI